MVTIYNNLPKLDLHCEIGDVARILINEFIEDSYKMKLERVMIIHGISGGVLRKVTQETLKRNKKVKSYWIDFFNPGTTIVDIERRN